MIAILAAAMIVVGVGMFVMAFRSHGLQSILWVMGGIMLTFIGSAWLSAIVAALR
jgi:hypothetical protein